MNNAPKLIEGNIVLRQPLKKDIFLRVEYGVNTEFAKMTGTGFDKVGKYFLNDAENWFESVKKHPCKWIIEYKNKFIGVVSLRPYYEDKKAKFSIELYDRSIYGNGIGSKVTDMVLRYAFEVKKYNKVFLRVLDFNTRAIKCYERCGFMEEGIDRDGAYIEGEFCSDIYMGILKSEYKKRDFLKENIKI